MPKRPLGKISFVPLGSDFTGKIYEVGKGDWATLMYSFPDLDNMVINQHYNKDQSAIISKADITLKDSGIQLRVADRFLINEEGDIIEQENHFDASPLRG